MPQLIQHIDQIARQKQRAVLFLLFNDPLKKGEDDGSWPAIDYQHHSARQTILAWFKAHGIAHYPCGHFASESWMMSYRGQIYIDIPFDESNPDYQKVRDYLENADGNMKMPGVKFCYLPLEIAMKNAHHDEPGFWDKWAENF
jgi:hypothetical protein